MICSSAGQYNGAGLVQGLPVVYLNLFRGTSCNAPFKPYNMKHDSVEQKNKNCNKEQSNCHQRKLMMSAQS